MSRWQMDCGNGFGMKMKRTLGRKMPIIKVFPKGEVQPKKIWITYWMVNDTFIIAVVSDGYGCLARYQKVVVNSLEGINVVRQVFPNMIKYRALFAKYRPVTVENYNH